MLFGSAKEGAHVPEQGDARRREAIIRSARGAGWTALRLGAGFTPVRNSKPPSPCKPICSARSRYVGDRGNRTIRARPHHCHRAKAKFEADNLELRLAVLATIQLRHELYPARFPRRAINAPPQGEFLLSGKSGNRDGKVCGGRRSRSIGASVSIVPGPVLKLGRDGTVGIAAAIPDIDVSAVSAGYGISPAAVSAPTVITL
jgi:hypothetical protein